MIKLPPQINGMNVGPTRLRWSCVLQAATVPQSFDGGLKGELSPIAPPSKQKKTKMFTKIPLLATLSVFATIVVAVSAATSSVPELIPGPGLPSLESLNLTSADLYAMGPPPALSKYAASSVGQTLTAWMLVVGARSADYTAICQTYSTAAVNDVIACFNYLVSIGNNACAVTNPDLVTWFCESGTAAISGSNTSGEPTVSSTW